MSQRISESVVNAVKDRADIVNVIGAYIDLKKNGSSHSSCCPFHDEKTASFSVNPKKQFFNCFGCGAGGNVIRFVMDYENITFPNAVRKLGKEYGVDVPDREISDQDRVNLKISGKLHQATAFAAKRFHKAMAHDAASAYVAKRGISMQSIKKFGLGFAPEGYDFLTKGAKAQWIDVNKRAGLIRESDKKAGHHYDFFRNRLMFPIRNIKGKTVGFSGRTLDDTVKPKYINSPENEIFKKSETLYGLYEALEVNDSPSELIVTEGYMDVIAFSSIGYNNSVATMGTALTDGHCELIFKHTDSVVFVFDGDKAGFAAAIRAAEVVAPYMHDGRSARFVILANGDDPDSMVENGLEEQLVEAVGLGICITDFLQRYAVSVCGDQKLVSNRAKVCNLLKVFVSLMPDSFLREIFISDIANNMSLNADTVRRLVLGEPKVANPVNETASDAPSTASIH